MEERERGAFITVTSHTSFLAAVMTPLVISSSACRKNYCSACAFLVASRDIEDQAKSSWLCSETRSCGHLAVFRDHIYSKTCPESAYTIHFNQTTSILSLGPYVVV
jgi:ribosomal protein L37E